MANKVVVEIDVESGDAEKKIEGINEGIQDVTESTEQAGDSFSAFGDVADGVSGGLISKLKGAKGSIGGLTTGFKGLRGAIMATGIGALVIALTSLVSYFTSTEEGAKKLKVATSFLSVVFKKLSDVAADLGGFIVSAFTEPQEALDKLKEKLQPVFDFLQDINTLVIGQVVKNFKQMGAVLTFVRIKFNELMGDTEEALKLQKELAETQAEINAINEAQSESWDDIKEAVGDAADAVVDGFKGIIEETKDAIDIAERYANSQINTRNLIQQLIVDNAKLTQTIDEQQKIIDDTTRSYDERKQALELQSEASAQLAENIAKQARAEESLLRQEIAMTANVEEREELETALAEKIAQRIDAEKQVNLVNLDNAQKTREIDREELDRKASILQQLNDLRLEAMTDEKEREAESLRLAEENALKELELLRATEEEKQAVKDYYAQIAANREAEAKKAADAQKVIDDAKEVEQDKAVRDSKIQLAQDALGAISLLNSAFVGGSEKSARRQFNINKALGIAEAVINTSRAITAQLAVPQDALTGANFVKAGIAAATGIAQIAKIKSAKFGGGGASGGGAPSFSGGGGQSQPTGAPQLDTSALETNTQNNIRAYVVNKDVTTASAETQQIEQQANLVV
tara:strand:+ start:1221 stop:3116 length:1896 start_codon:yes stop_codon:yes gene_type:complete